jgi:hypothetical protein
MRNRHLNRALELKCRTSHLKQGEIFE